MMIESELQFYKTELMNQKKEQFEIKTKNEEFFRKIGQFETFLTEK